MLTSAVEAVEPAHIRAVRAFNRHWTEQIGLLNAGLVDTPYSLTEARVLYELAQENGTDVADLRRRLHLDSGHLSRLLARLRGAGVVETGTSTSDGRRQVASLTDHGRREFALLDERTVAQIAGLLAPHAPAQRRRLVGAMDAIRAVTGAEPPDRPVTSYVLRSLRPGDLGWIVERNAVVYQHEFGWDASYETLVARIVTDFAEAGDPRSDAWIAEVDGERAGSVLCVRRDDETAQLRLLLVEPSARGLGIGARLVDECIAFARRTGYRRLVLWTNDVLVAARRIYDDAGFTLVDSESHHSFGHDLVGQTLALDLT